MPDPVLPKELRHAGSGESTVSVGVAIDNSVMWCRQFTRRDDPMATSRRSSSVKYPAEKDVPRVSQAGRELIRLSRKARGSSASGMRLFPCSSKEDKPKRCRWAGEMTVLQLLRPLTTGDMRQSSDPAE